MTNRQIARGRGVSLDAVKFHIENAVQKLGLEGRAGLRKWQGAPRGSALSKQERTMTTSNLEMGPVGQIARHVADIDRSEAWFRDVLGLKHLYSFPSSIGKLAFFDCGGTRLFLETARDGTPGEQSVLYFRVPDISAAYAELQGRGVEFTDAPHMIFKHPDGVEEWMAFFKDCDGQVLSIMSQVKV
jgi:catechol 2,3-dioxygenase-like lactoylglutathione lyase family enzyme